ncbi:OmpP1/FadL family transporter [Chenggangzhangella methanolivorans]|uniref:OmpP1/FadL family transporter n=1 Tax=Chenggangzhangella methanolivorans TaxID=1437009 RepID=UPI003616A563
MSVNLKRRVILSSGAVALCALCASSTAFAGAFAPREQSAVGQGMSFAGMAAGGGDSISGMFWNPAVINQVEHFQGEQHVSVIVPDSTIDVTSALGAFGDSGNIGKVAALTSGYSAYRVSDTVVLGLSINTPFGLATDPKSNWGGQIYARNSRVRSINATPTVGVQLTDWLSIAGGVQIQWFDIRLKRAVGNGVPGDAVLPGAGSATLKGDDIGVGFTAGMTIEPMEGTSIGVGFRSSVSHTLDGKLYGPNPPLPADFDVKAKVKLPEVVTFGIRQKLTNELTALGGFEWTNWSRLKTVNVKTGGLGTIQTLPFNYDDGYFVSGGLEYAYSPDLTVRGGVGYEWSPISTKNRDVRLPDDNRWWLSAGGSYNYSEKLSFDLGYSYVFVPGKSKIDIAPDPLVGAPGLQGKAKSDVHIVSAAVRYKFGGEAPAALVTKY